MNIQQYIRMHIEEGDKRSVFYGKIYVNHRVFVKRK